MNRVISIDFETTGVDPKTCHPLEVSTFNDEIDHTIFIKPPISIPAETSAIHHIVDNDVANADDWPTVKATLSALCASEPLTVLVAHNASYEQSIIGEGFCSVLWVCTYKCALRVWPDAPSHKNEALRYWLKLDDNLGRSHEQFPHSAAHDTRVTYSLFRKLLEFASLEQMIEWTEQPAKLPKIPMGKFYGKTWAEADSGYLTWCCNQKDMREDVKYCAAEELKRRRGG